ncbi:MAG: type II secretion system GspH family protein [Candidatus Omnitrophica bacterium]|nr:type II secretion system GspH family protein [Candidatus Omnitrophota bacterium]
MKNKNIWRRRSFTLVELIVIIAIAGFVIVSITGLSMFFVRKVKVNKERYNMWSQISYTFDDMRMRCISAINIITPVSSGGVHDLESDGAFIFFAEDDIYNVSPDDLTDNVWYQYMIDQQGNLRLEKGAYSQASGFVANDSEIIVDEKYNPNLSFRHEVGDEPNFAIAKIDTDVSVAGEDLDIEREEGIRFWFVDLAQ